MILKKINNPQDLKQLSLLELNTLSDELREGLFHRLSRVGGHHGPNFGVVELTLALHRVFNSPTDKLIFDISHQTYVHKMLTGRAESFLDESEFGKITGFTDPAESEHDHYVIGHTSTSVSLAHGMAKARDLKGTSENVIAVIGDGSLSGGLALEGLSNIGEMNSNLIVVVNDNDQSIAENHGGLYKNLKELRDTNGNAETNLFTAMGLDYIYVDEGHDLAKLINIFESVKDSVKPVVVHVRTIKGKGFKNAEINRESFHYGGAFDLKTGEYKNKSTSESYNSKTSELLKKEMDNDKSVAVITAGTPGTLGFNQTDREKYKEQFIDTGIAEEHAATMASAMAKAGAKPVFGVMSTFMQRAYDQISHDIGINQNPATILVYGGGMAAMNDVTHLGFYDIAMLNTIPNIVYLSPTTLEEHVAMVKYAIHQQAHPTAIRVPLGELKIAGEVDKTDYSQLNKFAMTNKGSKVALIGAGNFYHNALKVAQILAKDGIEATVINPKFTSGLDTKMLDELVLDHELVITIEDGQIEGGFGQMVASYLGDKKVKVKNFGIKKQFIDKFDVNEFMSENQLLPEQIANYAISNIQSK